MKQNTAAHEPQKYSRKIFCSALVCAVSSFSISLFSFTSIPGDIQKGAKQTLLCGGGAAQKSRWDAGERKLCKNTRNYLNVKRKKWKEKKRKKRKKTMRKVAQKTRGQNTRDLVSAQRHFPLRPFFFGGSARWLSSGGRQASFSVAKGSPVRILFSAVSPRFLVFLWDFSD